MLFNAVGQTAQANSWQLMKQQAQIVNSVNTIWYQQVGLSIFVSQVINLVSPQATIFILSIIDKFGSLFKNRKLFYTEEDIKSYFIGPEFDISSRLG